MKKKRLTIIVTGSVLFLAVLCTALFANPFVIKNRYDFGQLVKAINTESVTLNEITSFEWDEVYTFEPYMPKQEMEKIIGFESNLLRETVSEDMVQLIFVKGNTVVCNIQGYSDNLGYGVIFSARGTISEKYSKISYVDNAVFSVEHINDKVILSRTV